MPDYAEGKIYKILNSVTDDTYIGSTTQFLCNRMKNHRNDHNNPNKHTYSFKLYKSFREVGLEHFYIELIEKYSCTSREELHAREGHWIRLEKPTLNSRIAGRTHKQYYDDNKEIFSQKSKEYREKNHENVLQKKKEFRERMKGDPTFKQKQKKYAEANKDRIVAYQKQYRENNQDRLRTHYSEQIKCECGCMTTRQHIQRHKRSPKHEQLMQMNKNS